MKTMKTMKSTKSTALKKGMVVSALFFFATLLSGCGYNKMQALDEKITSSWAEVVNQYQRRADLIPNLIAAVKGYASHEKEIFTQITDAQKKIGSIQLTADAIKDPATIAKFQQAQGELGGALSRLIAVSNQYPELKANTVFTNLMTQLEGTENRIAVARREYIETVREYNTLIRQFPSNLTAKMFGMESKANFKVENESAISTAPKVEF